MSGSSSNYIPFHVSAADNIKIRRVARALKESRPHLLGHLGLLWSWAVVHRKDGVLQGLSDEEIAECAEWDGDACSFVMALITHDLLDTEPLRIHDWDEYGGKIARNKEENRLRQALFRDRSAVRNDSVTVTSQLPNMLDKTRQDKNRQDQTTSSSASQGMSVVEVCQYEEVLGEQRITTITRRASGLSPQLDEKWLRQALRVCHGILGDRDEGYLVAKVKLTMEALARALTLPPGHKNTIVAPKPYARQVLLTTLKGDE